MPESETPQVYVDPELCTGCGLCVEVCSRGAIQVVGSTAEIDPALCTRCGRCADECPVEAILSVEVLPQPKPPASKIPGLLIQAQTPLKSPESQAASPRSETLERTLSGLLSVVAWFLDRRSTRSPDSRTGRGIAAGGAIRADGGMGAGRRRQRGQQGHNKGVGCGRNGGGGRKAGHRIDSD